MFVFFVASFLRKEEDRDAAGGVVSAGLRAFGAGEGFEGGFFAGAEEDIDEVA